MLGTSHELGRGYRLPWLLGENGPITSTLEVHRPYQAVLMVEVLNPGEGWELAIETGFGEDFEPVQTVRGDSSTGPGLFVYSLSRKLSLRLRATLTGQGNPTVLCSVVGWDFQNTSNLPKDGPLTGLTPA